MTLNEALKQIALLHGPEELCSRRLHNLLSDYGVFYEVPSMRYVMKTLAEEAVVRDVMDHAEDVLALESVMMKAAYKFGFRNELIVSAVNAVLYAIGKKGFLPELPSAETTEDKAAVGKESQHIAFSGVSLAEDIAEVARALTKRGFYVKSCEPYCVKMEGTFCDISGVRLFVCGSPFNLTKKLYLEICDLNSLNISHLNKLYPLLIKKYGAPFELEDPLNSIGKDFDHYAKHCLKYSDAKRDYDTVFIAKWRVEGGEIELQWLGEKLTLTYTDSANTAYCEAHQDDFNLSSI